MSFSGAGVIAVIGGILHALYMHKKCSLFIAYFVLDIVLENTKVKLYVIFSVILVVFTVLSIVFGKTELKYQLDYEQAVSL